MYLVDDTGGRRLELPKIPLRVLETCFPTLYRVPEDFDFPEAPDYYYDHEAFEGDNVEIDTFYIDQDGRTVYVVDKFDTEDGYGCVVLTVNALDRFALWSVNATFYELRRDEPPAVPECGTAG